jgi:hypothetical protein
MSSTSRKSFINQSQTPQQTTSVIRMDAPEIEPAQNFLGRERPKSILGGQTIGDSANTPVKEPLSSPAFLFSVMETQERRHSSVSARVQVRNRRKNYGLLRDHTRSVQDNFLTVAENFVSQQSGENANNLESGLKLLNAALDDLRMYSSRFRLEEDGLQQEEAELNIRETELYEGETNMYNELGRIAGKFPSISRGKQPARHKTSHSTRSTSTARTHPRARRYYDRAGDVKNLRERLHNLQAQHHQDIVIRQNHKEVGQSVFPSEKTFRKRYLNALVTLVRELEIAKADAHQLKLACHKHRVDVEDGKESFDKEEVIHLSLKLEREMIRHAATQTQDQWIHGADSLGDILSGYMDSNARVRAWLADTTRFTNKDITQDFATQQEAQMEPKHNMPLSPSLQSITPSMTLQIAIASASQKQVGIEANDLAETPADRPDYPQESRRSSGSISSAGGSMQSSTSVYPRLEPKFEGDPPRRRYSDSGEMKWKLPSDELCTSCLNQTRPQSVPTESVLYYAENNLGDSP